MLNSIRRSSDFRAWTLLFPTAIWMGIFFVAPLLTVLVYGFLQRGTYGGVVWTFSVAIFQRVFDPQYFNTFYRSAYIAVLTAILCLLLGYPMAYYIATRPLARRHTLILTLMIPFWTNFLIRTYAWLNLLRTNTTLIDLGLIQNPLPLFGNDFAIVLGLVYGWLPEVVLPVYAALERMNPSLVEAAGDLYASGYQVFRRVIWPLSLPGVIAGSMLVFIPSLGAFVTPAILGRGKS
jgi:spermidine/putrescine transport system permease protein